MLGQILLVILIILAWIGVRSLLQQRLDRAQQEGDTGASEDGHLEEMVRCAHCRVFLPRGQAYPGDGGYYCSAEHRRLGPGRSEQGRPPPR